MCSLLGIFIFLKMHGGQGLVEEISQRLRRTASGPAPAFLSARQKTATRGAEPLDSDLNLGTWVGEFVVVTAA
jgi:hypothetical protein